MVPVLCFPSVNGPALTDLTMNYTCLLYGGVMTLALSWYAIDARKWFKGPKVNVSHLANYTEGHESGASESPNVLEVEGKKME